MSRTTTTISSPGPSLPSSTSPTTSVPVFADFNYYLPPPGGAGPPSTNDLELILGSKDQETRRLPVTDVRGREHEFNLESNGFCYVRSPTKLSPTDFNFDERIEGEAGYYGEVEQMLKGLFPTISQTHHLGHILRGAPRRTDFTHTPTSQPTDPAWNRPNRGAAPAPRVHIDFTRRGVHLVLTQAFGDAAAAAATQSGRRFLCFSVWRPIRPVRRDPLAVCDARSVRAAELVRLERLYPDGRRGENVVVKATAAGATAGEREECQHRWHWMSAQQPDEVLVIKIFDSGGASDAWERGAGGRVGVAPHASFHLDGTHGEAIRESIEIRVVVVL